MGLLENAASRGDKIPDRILLDVSRIHLFQPDGIERSGNLLETRLRHIYTESSKLAVQALEQQASLATNILKSFVQSFRDEHQTTLETSTYRPILYQFGFS